VRAFAGPPGVFGGLRAAKTTQKINDGQEAGPGFPSAGIEREGEMFAVIKTGGKQYRVAADEVIKVAKVAGEAGDVVEFGEVLVLGGDNTQLGTPTVSGVTVAGEVVAQERGPKIIAFKKRRRKNSRRKRGYREQFTLVRITEILTDGKKPEKKAKPEPQEAPASAQGETAAEPEPKPKKAKPAAKKAAKPAAKAKKPAKGQKK
jgi:large subunit ribosomal protein L21